VTPAAMGESNERRRRRRRRGRRGRRFEQEIPVSGDSSMPDSGIPMGTDIAVAHAGAQESFGIETGFSASHSESIAVVPNTPSSPVWTLLDQQIVPELRAAPPEPLAARPEAAEITDVPAASPQPIEAETEPRETRKGWWQRRFKA